MSNAETSSASAHQAEASSGEPAEAGNSDEPPSRPPDQPPLAVRTICQTQAPDGVEAWLSDALQAAAAPLRLGGAVTLVLVDDAQMSELHGQWRGEASTTDVLSFDLGESDAPAGRVEGDLVLCVDEAARQASRRGHDLALELLLYAVHGLLHLLGEDDADADQARRMHEREDALLRQAGFGPVYDREARGE